MFPMFFNNAFYWPNNVTLTITNQLNMFNLMNLFNASDILEVDIAFLLATFVLLMLSLISAGISSCHHF